MNKVVWDGFDCGWLAKHCSVYTYTPVQTHFQNHSPLFQTAQSSPKQGKDIHVRLYDKLHCPVTHTVLLCHNHFHLGRTMQRGDAMYCERDNDPATMDVYCLVLHTSVVTGSLLHVRTEAFFSHMPDFIFKVPHNSARSVYEGSTLRIKIQHLVVCTFHF